MSNLLPYNEKKIVARSMVLRIVKTAVWIFASIAIIYLILLAPAVLLVRTQQQLSAKEIEQFKKHTTVPTAINLATLESRIAALRTALVTAESHPPLEYVQFLQRHTPANIQLESFLLQNEEQKKYAVRGTATTRAGLQAFTRVLGQLPEIATVDVPIENFVKSTDAPFSLTITFKE